MRIGTITLLVTVSVSFSRPALCQDHPSGPLSAALHFFEQAASSDIDSTLRGFRKNRLSSEERDLTRAMLHRESALVPTAAEVTKLDALKPLLIYHERDTAAVTVLLDRLLHQAHALKCGPRSWRAKVQTDLRTDERSRTHQSRPSPEIATLPTAVQRISIRSKSDVRMITSTRRSGTSVRSSRGWLENAARLEGR